MAQREMGLAAKPNESELMLDGQDQLPQGALRPPRMLYGMHAPSAINMFKNN